MARLKASFSLEIMKGFNMEALIGDGIIKNLDTTVEFFYFSLRYSRLLHPQVVILSYQ